MFQMLGFLMLLLFFVKKCDSTCIIRDYYIQCDSLKFVKSTGIHRNWEALNVNSSGIHETIDADFLKQIPNVNRLIFENSVNNIEDYSFAHVNSSIRQLFFKKCDLTVVKKNWFINLNNFRILIHESKVTTLEERCFDGAELVYLEGNNISRINANVFNGTLIKTLDLENNQIRLIEENALANMTKLITIWLNKNLLTTFNSKLIAGPQKNLNLTTLLLQSNQINYLNPDSFAAFPNIKVIYLNWNELEFIDDGTFNELNQLEELNLSHNKLKTIPEKAFSFYGLPFLTKLQLHRNRFNYVPFNFIHNFPKLQEISIFENPWQCACYNDIIKILSVYYKNISISRSEKYLNGQRPVCVETYKDKCTENIENYDEISKNFTNTLNQYPKVEFKDFYGGYWWAR